jgi:hypothetical protein
MMRGILLLAGIAAALTWFWLEAWNSKASIFFQGLAVGITFTLALLRMAGE